MQNQVSLLELHNSVYLRLKDEGKTFVSLCYHTSGAFVLTFQDRGGNLIESKSEKVEIGLILSDLFYD